MWDSFIDILAQCIGWGAGIVGDWGLSIIILTIAVRLLMLPLTLKQQKSMADMQVLTPKLQEIQTRYADDPQRMNEEMTKFYAEHKFNPLAGCLPMFIQMPIFIALFSVLRDHVPAEACFYGILPSLATSAGTVLGASGILAALPYIIFVLLFGILTFLPMFLMQNNGANASMTKGMSAMMTVMMLFVGWSSPAGVVLFWVVSSAWAVVQQQIITKKKQIQVQEEQKAELANKPVEVDIVRRKKKARPHKKN